MVIEDIRQDAQYTIKEASEILGIHRVTLYKYFAQGLIPKRYRKATMRPYVKGSDLLRFVRAEA